MASFAEKMRSLLRGLTAATADGRQNWTVTDRRHAYMTTVRGRQRLVIAAKDDDGLAPHMLLIHDDEGELIDVFYGDDDGLHPGLMQDLYDHARRNASGVDQVLDDLLKAFPERDQ